ncbi:MAG: cupin domain-containing protein, partial [Candidatus Brocadiales bacterium]
MITKNIILYVIVLAIVSGCDFLEEIRHPSSFPKYYPNSHQSVDKIIKDDPLAEGENLRVTYIAETKTSLIRLVHIRKDAEIGVHTHENHDEIVYQVKGSGIAVLSGNQHPIKPGILLLIPRGTPHSFINGAEDSIALSFFSPPLEASPNSKAALPIEQDGKLAVPFVRNLYEISKGISPEEDVKKIELINSPHTSLHLVMVRKDAEIGLHFHKLNDEVIYVINGSGIIILHGTR